MATDFNKIKGDMAALKAAQAGLEALGNATDPATTAARAMMGAQVAQLQANVDSDLSSAASDAASTASLFQELQLQQLFQSAGSTVPAIISGLAALGVKL